MLADSGCTDRADLFALVGYIPEPLAHFLNCLRRELVPGCFLRAHVTVLPPRPCSTSPETACHQIQTASKWFQPFQVELGSVELFPVSDVIYLSIAKGEKELRQMHALMNCGGLRYQEPYPFHPHITVAQNLKPDQLDEFVRVARQRWADFSSPRTFDVNAITFVQSTKRKTWLDLEHCPLGADDSFTHHAFTDGDPRILRP